MKIVQRVRAGGVWGSLRTVAPGPGFKGYTAAIEQAFGGRVEIAL